METSSSSHDQEELKRHLAGVQRISSELNDQSSLLESIGERAEELKKCKEECIALKTQLKISRESSKMMEAEFAFQKEQLEMEVQKLKDQEAQLREALVKAQSAQTEQHYDVSAHVTIEQKYKKWKGVAEQLKQENEKLKSEMSESSKRHEAKEKEFADAFERQTKHLNNRIERRNKALEDLRVENTELMERLQEMSEVATSGESDDDMTRLKQKIARQQKQLQKMNQLSARNQELIMQNAHYDAERQVLNDIMQTEDIDPNMEWVRLRAKAKEGMEAIAKVRDNSQFLMASEKRINGLLKAKQDAEDLAKRLEESEKKNQQLSTFAQKVAAAETQLCEYKATTERIRAFAAQQKIRVDFARTVAANQKQLIDNISSIYEALIGKREQYLRPIALAVVFLNRWKRIRDTNTGSFDASSLVSFISVPTNTVEAKLKGIKKLFVALSQELIEANNKAIEEKKKAQEIKRQFVESGGDMESARVQLQNAQTELQQYKQKVKELIAENAKMVAPDRFEEMLSRTTDIELQNDELQQSLEEKQAELDSKDDLIRQMDIELKKADSRHEDDQAALKRAQEEAERQKEENNVLLSKLSDRTKDLLSLERMTGFKCDTSGKTSRADPVPVNPAFLQRDVTPVV